MAKTKTTRKKSRRATAPKTRGIDAILRARDNAQKQVELANAALAKVEAAKASRELEARNEVFSAVQLVANNRGLVTSWNKRGQIKVTGQRGNPLRAVIFVSLKSGGEFYVYRKPVSRGRLGTAVGGTYVTARELSNAVRAHLRACGDAIVKQALAVSGRKSYGCKA